MQTWFTKIVLVVIIFLMGVTVLFSLLVIGVQYGDTYNGKNHASFPAAAKYVVSKAVHQIKNGIYHGATIYNPPGDTIPDSWDNSIISEIKQFF